VIESLASFKPHKHQGLINRWATALDWFAEGSREKNDAIAVAKIATALDVLACVGKFGGILSMLENLFSITDNTQVIGGESPKTLRQLVKKIYDDGRSKILHGSYANRLESYAELRVPAEYVTRIALLESVIRLKSYNGDDKNTAFRDMPPIGTNT
jgi:hypothetical protein